MTNTIEYEKALDNTEQYLSCSVGYSKYEAASHSDKEIIRKNNVIINLLEQLIQKVNTINGSLSKSIQTSPELGEILDKIKTMKVGEQPNIKKTIGHTFGTEPKTGIHKKP